MGIRSAKLLNNRLFCRLAKWCFNCFNRRWRNAHKARANCCRLPPPAASCCLLLLLLLLLPQLLLLPAAALGNHAEAEEVAATDQSRRCRARDTLNVHSSSSSSGLPVAMAIALALECHKIYARVRAERRWRRWQTLHMLSSHLKRISHCRVGGGTVPAGAAATRTLAGAGSFRMQLRLV